nr:MAG TPA: hypothetical protein [Caudoviricetes sp.]
MTVKTVKTANRRKSSSSYSNTIGGMRLLSTLRRQHDSTIFSVWWGLRLQ